MTNREAFIITACQISIELGRTPDMAEPICASWGGTPGDYHENAVLLAVDPDRPASLFLTVRPGEELAPGERLHTGLFDKLAATVQILNRDFEPAVSIEFSVAE